ncbi:MAG TPA: pirin family protein [Burkholderiales bacterium]|nr:pirin family protein [Burkholderiales bacterium]
MSSSAMPLDALIVPRTRDLGEGLQVRRALPDAKRRMVGPFVFFDQMGPVAFAKGQGIDVRPHPHIGLATVTYLFEGEIMHRDSLGTVQPIRAGEVNWMTAGRGIVHSERTPPALRASGSRAFGIQLWVGLPAEQEETAPAFAHHPAADLPVIKETGVQLRLIIGELFGKRSPVRTFSDMFYADATLEGGARLTLRPEYGERAAYVAEGAIDYEGKIYQPAQLLVFRPGADIVIKASPAARVLLLGGAPLGERYIWWNFVSSRKERIAQAAADWQAGRFPPVPGETELIPLPQRPPGVVNYP